MPAKKFSFSDILTDIPEVSTESKVSITAGGQMIIPRDVWTKFGLEDVCVRVQFDPIKRALAFKKLFVEFQSPEWDKKRDRKLEVNTAAKKMRVPLGRLLKTLGLGGVSYKGIVMDKYVDTIDGRDYYYVILPKNASTGPTAGIEAEAPALN